MSVTIKTQGFKELAEKLAAIGEVLGATTGRREVSKALKTAARKAMVPCAQTAKQLAPVKLGILRDAIRVATVVPKSGNAIIVVGIKIGKALVRDELPTFAEAEGGGLAEVGSVAASHREDAHWRWHWAEYGTSRQMAHPFLRPAFARHKNQILETFRAELAAAIQKILKKNSAATSGISLSSDFKKAA